MFQITKTLAVGRLFSIQLNPLVRSLSSVHGYCNLSWSLQSCLKSPKIIPVRHASLLSFFSRGRRTDDESTENEKSNEEDLWVNVIKDAQEGSLKPSAKPSSDMTRTEIRAWKKHAFLHIIEVFLQRTGKTKRGFNKFIMNALSKMSEYEVADDLECYKAVISVFPTGRMVVTRYLQAEGGFYSRQQDTMIKILQQMARNHVLPDDQVGQMIIDIFGWRNRAMQHYRQMMYWVPKLYYSNPWTVPVRILDHLDQDPLHLAKLIAERICVDRNTEFSLVQADTSTPSDYQNCLVSAQSPDQRALLSFHAQSNPDTVSSPIYVDGPNYVWFRNLQAAYYTMWTEINSGRIARESQNVDKLLKFRPCNSREPLDLTFFGKSTQSDDIIPNVSFKRTEESIALPITQEEQQSSIEKSRTIPTKLSLRITNAEPEFDNRWLALRQNTEMKSLPSQLSVHEQGEGVVLALAVIVPRPDALENQNKFYSNEVSNHSTAAGFSSSEKFPLCDEKPIVETIPRSATSGLIRNWVSHLRKTNPSLDNSTLLIRVQNESIPSCDNDDAHKTYGNESTSEDPLRRSRSF